MDIFNVVLSENSHLEGVTDPAQRLQIIVKDLFIETYTRVSPGLLHDHRMPFAVTLTNFYVQHSADDLDEAEFRHFLTGGAAAVNDGLEGGYYIQPTILKGNNKMRVFQEEIFGPVVCVTTFKDEAEALEIANDTLYGLGAGVWTRDMHQAYQISRAVQAGRVWVNCYHAYPAHAPFGGYKKSGIGRETHKMMLNHYRQTKNMLISYDKNALGFF